MNPPRRSPRASPLGRAPPARACSAPAMPSIMTRGGSARKAAGVPRGAEDAPHPEAVIRVTGRSADQDRNGHSAGARDDPGEEGQEPDEDERDPDDRADHRQAHEDPEKDGGDAEGDQDA